MGIATGDTAEITAFRHCVAISSIEMPRSVSGLKRIDHSPGVKENDRLLTFRGKGVEL
jgi:hypothetical protein